MNYRIVERESFELIGVGIMVNMETVGEKAYELWQKSSADGTCDKLAKLAKSELGHGVTCYREDDAAQTWSYHIAYENKSGTAIPEDGFEIMKIPAHTWVVFESTAPLKEAMKELWGKAYSEWLPSSGYTCFNGPEMEIYHPDKIELWIPVRKA